jgi:hypothetical protein
LLSADSTTTGSTLLAQDELARTVEAVGVADFGEQVKGQDRADPEGRLECLAAAIAAGEATHLALERVQLLLSPPMTVSITSTCARAHASSSSPSSTQRRPSAVKSRTRARAHTHTHTHSRPSWVNNRMEALRPAGALCSEGLAQTGLVTQTLDLGRWQPRLALGQKLPGEQQRKAIGRDPVGLRPSPASLQRARPARIDEPHLETTQLQLTRDPAPTGRGIDRTTASLPCQGIAP